jgi:hypothetical protein
MALGIISSKKMMDSAVSRLKNRYYGTKAGILLLFFFGGLWTIFYEKEIKI